MKKQDLSRRSLLTGGGTLAGMTMLGMTAPHSAFWQPREEILPWVDQPPPPPPDAADVNLQPWESLVDSWLTPSDRFFNVHHYDQPENLDEATWRVGVTGLVANPRSLTIADLKARERREVDFTLECSGGFLSGSVYGSSSHNCDHQSFSET